MPADKGAAGGALERPRSGTLRKSSKTMETRGGTKATAGKKRHVDPEVILSKLASFDFPRPPSPAHCQSPLLLRKAASNPSLLRGTVGTVPFAAAASSPSRASLLHRSEDPEQRAEQLQKRAELWSYRTEIEREKLRSVPPFPFFGHAMRFQDEFSALQITDDGRFIYSACGSEEEQRQHICTTYEGVFGSQENLIDAVLDPTARPCKEFPEGALIEGIALVKHDIENECMVDVVRGNWRFAITVFPFYQPTSAAVQLLVKQPPQGSRPGPPPRCRRVPYVGPGFQTRDLCNNLQPRHRREGQKLKFSRSSTTLVLGGKALSSLTNSQMALNRQANKTADDHNRQVTQETALGLSGIGKESQLTKKKADGPQTVAEWKAFYRRRAEEILANEPPMPPTAKTSMTRTAFGLTTG